MAILTTPLPADLPENWQANQIVAPNGADVGLSAKHGYNYQSSAINLAQRGVNAALADLATVETSPTANAYSIGDYLVFNGKLYRVTAPISAGGAIVTSGAGANVTAATIAAEMQSMTAGGTITLDGVFTSANQLLKGSTASFYSTASQMASATVGNYALFQDMGSVFFVDAALTYSPVALPNSAHDTFGASVGDYAIFAGGVDNSANYKKDAYAFDASLTRTDLTDLSVARTHAAAATVGNYALFAGGYTSSMTMTVYATVDTYDASLTHSTAANLSVARYKSAGSTAASYAIIAGGANASGTRLATVDTYNASLTHGTATDLSVARGSLSGASIGNYSLFVGGDHFSSSTVYDAAVDTYDTSLTHGTATNLSAARADLSSTTVSGYAVFAGGNNNNSQTIAKAVDAYDASLTHSTAPDMIIPRTSSPGFTTLGDLAIITGGDPASTVSARIETYFVGYALDIDIPPWSKYYIDGVTPSEAFTLDGATISETAQQPFTGYIKPSGYSLSGAI